MDAEGASRLFLPDSRSRNVWATSLTRWPQAGVSLVLYGHGKTKPVSRTRRRAATRVTWPSSTDRGALWRRRPGRTIRIDRINSDAVRTAVQPAKRLTLAARGWKDTRRHPDARRRFEWRARARRRGPGTMIVQQAASRESRDEPRLSAPARGASPRAPCAIPRSGPPRSSRTRARDAGAPGQCLAQCRRGSSSPAALAGTGSCRRSP
jgi:hypothetical protein